MLKSRATLRIASKTHSLNEISARIGRESNGGYSKGDSFSKKDQRKRAISLWKLKSTLDEDLPLAVHVSELLEAYEAFRETLKVLEDIDCDISCFLSSDNGQGAFELNPSTMKRLADNKLPILFDIYCSEET